MFRQNADAENEVPPYNPDTDASPDTIENTQYHLYSIQILSTRPITISNNAVS